MRDLQRIRYFADLSVKRACGFAILGILMMMGGLSTEPALALRIGAAAFTITMLVLVYAGWRAPQISYRRREVWVLLDGQHGLPEDRAQDVISNVMRDTFWGYAEKAAWIGLALWIAYFLAA